MVANIVLIVDLVRGSKVTASAASLLSSGALIWLGNALVFGLLYWELDCGGPLARYRGGEPIPTSRSPQQLNPELAPAGWRPRYVDYLVLGITTSTAFSPTDVMPMAAWAKLTMALQSLISLTVIGLVIARASTRSRRRLRRWWCRSGAPVSGVRSSVHPGASGAGRQDHPRVHGGVGLSTDPAR